jgi:WD40 repeat protein
VQIWESETGLAVSKFDVFTDVAFSPDGMRLVSGSLDMTVRVWDLKTGVVIAGPYEGHTGGVCSVAFLPNGKHHSIRIWEV